MNKHLISIVGPTAIGKTALSIKLAEHYNTEIISADSRQFYREMQIGTAVPTVVELETVKHHFIHHKSIEQNYNVGAFERDALDRLNSLFKSHDIVIMVGGSGLYVNAVTKGLDDFPEVDKGIRLKLNQQFLEQGMAGLQEQLELLDIESYNTIAIDNPQRVIRALEICIGTGKPYSSFLKQKKNKRPFKTITIGLTADREIIYNRINERVDIMIKNGLVNEVESLQKYQHLNALNTVGYKELFKYFDEEWSLEFAIDEIKKNSRRFAKRQLTWFKKNHAIIWFDYLTELNQIIHEIDKRIKPTEDTFGANEYKLDNPVWHALSETHKNAAIDYGKVKFYHPDYAPFGAFIDGKNTRVAIEEHARLIQDFFIVGEKPKMPSNFNEPKEYIGLQMVVRNKIDYPITERIIELTDTHYQDLMVLIKLVYPEYFKAKTQQLGQYYGIFKDGTLVSAAGERMQTSNFIEISAVITHPDYTGNGYAKQLIAFTADVIFKKNKIPILHVDETNLGPIQLYKKLGFTVRRAFSFWKISSPYFKVDDR